MLPQNVAHEWRNSGQESLFAQTAHLFAPHAEVAEVDAVQRELFDRPVQPVFDVRFTPLSWICSSPQSVRRLVREAGLTLRNGQTLSILVKTSEASGQRLRHLQRRAGGQWRHLSRQICGREQSVQRESCGFRLVWLMGSRRGASCTQLNKRTLSEWNSLVTEEGERQLVSVSWDFERGARREREKSTYTSF